MISRRPAHVGPLAAGCGLAAIVWAGVILGADTAQAQAVSPVTVAPQTLVPDQRDHAVRVDIPEAGALHAPAGAETLTVTLGDVHIDGGFAEVARQIDPVVQGLRGHRVTLAQIYAAASAIEAIHARAGYVLARVSVPPQDLADGGTLRIVVTDGFVEAVALKGLPARVQRAVRARVAKLVNRHHVTLAQIEQALLIAGDVPGLALRSTLARGKTPGGTQIVLEGTQHWWQGSLGSDNQIDRSVDAAEINLQLALNSVLGLGEQIYGYATSGYQVNRLFAAGSPERVLGGGVILPLGDGRISVNPEVLVARIQPAPAAGSPQTVGLLRRLTFRTSATLLRTRRSQAVASLSLEQTEEANKAPAFDADISRDRYMVLRPGVQWSTVTPANAGYSVSLQYSRGLGKLGAITAEQALASKVPFSRQGAGTGFDKLVITAHAAWDMGQGAGFSVNVRGQTGFGAALFRAEQISLEGADGLSAYVGGRTAVDTGVVARSELSLRIATPARSEAIVAGVTPYLFNAVGFGRLIAPTAAEYGHSSAINLGAGLRATVYRRIVLAGEFARGLSDQPALDKANRINASATLRF